MSYSALNPIDETKITRLGFEAEPCNYLYSSSDGGQRSGTVYKVDNSTYDNVKEILIGNETHSISKGDKVFILPGHPLAADRIRTYLKKIGANITKNVNIATIVAGTDDFNTKLSWNEQAKFQYIMMYWKDGYTVKGNDIDQIDSTFDKLHTIDPVMRDRPSYLSPSVGRFMGDINIQMAGEHLTFLTPLAIDVIYNVLSRRLKVVTASTIADDANSELKLTDKDTFISISSMLNSTDITNRKMGTSLLFHCDLRGETRYDIWKLASTFDNVVRYTDKTKSRDHFMTRTRWKEFSRMNQEDFLIDAKRENYLTQEILDDIIPKLQGDQAEYVASILNTDFYEHEIQENGDIVIKLSDKWKEVEHKTEEDESIQLQTSSMD